MTHRLTQKLKALFLIVTPKLNFRVRPGEESQFIVLINLDSLGDTILFSVVIQSVRKSFPNAEIQLITRIDKKPFYALCDLLDSFFFLPRQKLRFRQFNYLFENLFTYVYLLLRYRGKLNKLIGPAWLMFDKWSELTTHLLQLSCPQQIPSLDEYAYKTLDQKHQILRQLEIISLFGVEKHVKDVNQWLIQPTSSRKQKTICFALGARHPRKCWPSASFFALIKQIIEIRDETIILIGDPFLQPDIEIFTEISNSPRVVNLIGRTNFVESAHRISESSLLIANDSGMGHLSAALGVRCVTISCHPENANPWHLASPLRFSPFMENSIVVQPKSLCEPCKEFCQSETSHCINEVQPEDVFRQICQVLEKEISSE